MAKARATRPEVVASHSKSCSETARPKVRTVAGAAPRASSRVSGSAPPSLRQRVVHGAQADGPLQRDRELAGAHPPLQPEPVAVARDDVHRARRQPRAGAAVAEGDDASRPASFWRSGVDAIRGLAAVEARDRLPELAVDADLERRLAAHIAGATGDRSAGALPSGKLWKGFVASPLPSGSKPGVPSGFDCSGWLSPWLASATLPISRISPERFATGGVKSTRRWSALPPALVAVSERAVTWTG